MIIEKIGNQWTARYMGYKIVLYAPTREDAISEIISYFFTGAYANSTTRVYA